MSNAYFCKQSFPMHFYNKNPYPIHFISKNCNAIMLIIGEKFPCISSIQNQVISFLEKKILHLPLIYRQKPKQKFSDCRSILQVVINDMPKQLRKKNYLIMWTRCQILKTVIKYPLLYATIEPILLVLSSYMVELEFSHVYYLLSKKRSTLNIEYGDLWLKLIFVISSILTKLIKK